jgi:hypothetical protein
VICRYIATYNRLLIYGPYYGDPFPFSVSRSAYLLASLKRQRVTMGISIYASNLGVPGYSRLFRNHPKLTVIHHFSIYRPAVFYILLCLLVHSLELVEVVFLVAREESRYAYLVPSHLLTGTCSHPVDCLLTVLV